MNVSSVGEEPVRIGDVIYVGLKLILSVDVSLNGICLLVYDGTFFISLFIWVSSTIWIGGGVLQARGATWVVSTVDVPSTFI